MEKKYINREISWLSFNNRVLQEASDKQVPLVERLRFLGIYSNNMDEFFKVRVATIRRMVGVGKSATTALNFKPKQLLKEIALLVKKQNKRFAEIYLSILKELEKEHIYILDEKQMNPEQVKFATKYFKLELRPKLVPIMLNYIQDFPRLKEQAIYLAVKINIQNQEDALYALIEIPSTTNRFVELPSEGEKRFLMIADDVIRYNLHTIFQQFDVLSLDAFCIKLTRDAELDLDIDISKSLIEKIEQSVEARKKGAPVRFVYDQHIDENLLSFLIHKLQMQDNENKIAGGRYHNFRDFMGFPDFGLKKLVYPAVPALTFPKFEKARTLFELLDKEDVLLHYPYQSFSYLIDFIREAAIDPQVTTIKMTLYRVAHNSMVANSLINAAKNGKKVVAVVELQARFDEESNIYWAKKMQEEGVTVIYGVPGLKVHSKLCLITRIKEGKRVRYANFSTGNFNEKTSKVYSDTALFTSDERLTYEANKVFQFFQNNYKVYNFKHLIVAPNQSRSRFYELIEQEVAFAKLGKPASIFAKMNSLVDPEMIDHLYQAAEKGVKIRLIIRGVCALIPELEHLKGNIEIISILDKYLEHSRVFIFNNDGKKKFYLSSSDWMQRNLDFRVEVSFPIFSKNLQKELSFFMENQWKDNVKSRIIDGSYKNSFKGLAGEPNRSQISFYEYLKDKYSTDEN
ncbi:MAG: polyphosphate kinase 1 [Chitinophagales bacterium]